MDILLRQARIVDSVSPYHLQTADILIQNGIITAIGSIDSRADEIISIDGLAVSPGWVDVFADFADPGYEFRESLQTGGRAAAAGGFTDVLLIPNTKPAIDTKTSVEYLKLQGKALEINIHPIGSVTRGNEGKELAEMYDMQRSGALAFSDGINSIQSPGLLLKALQYLKANDAVLIQLPTDRSLSAGGLMNEGIISTQLGLPGMPAIAEELMISRDIELAKYTGGRIHFTGISTARSVKLIDEAKQEGVQVSCSVTPYHLFFCDEDLQDYDSNLKVNPPLRPRADRDELKKAVLEGKIDCIASHHLPYDVDHKEVEFEYASNGMIGLETCFAVVKTAIPELTDEDLVDFFSIRPRKIFGVDAVTIDLNQPAILSLFVSGQTWIPTGFESRSRNSPFLGKQLTGQAVGIINQNKIFLQQQETYGA